MIGAVICYDITNRDSFEQVLRYYRKARRHFFLVNGAIHLVGCKSDLKAHRQVHTWEAQKLAHEFDMLFYETSALTGENVDLTFLNWSLEVLDRLERNEYPLEPAFLGLQFTSSLERLACSSKLHGIYSRVIDSYEQSLIASAQWDDDELSGMSLDGSENSLDRFVEYPRGRRVRHLTGPPQYAPGWSRDRVQAENDLLRGMCLSQEMSPQ